MFVCVCLRICVCYPRCTFGLTDDNRAIGSERSTPFIVFDALIFFLGVIINVYDAISFIIYYSKYNAHICLCINKRVKYEINLNDVYLFARALIRLETIKTHNANSINN